MLIRCPECRRQVSETANTCQKCGFIFDESTREALRNKAIQTNRLVLGILAGFLLSVWLIFAVTTLGGKQEGTGHYIGGGQREAFDKFQRGERLTDSEVADLAEGPRHVSPEEEREADWSVFNCCSVVFGLPGLIIVLYLVLTRQQSRAH